MSDTVKHRSRRKQGRRPKRIVTTVAAVVAAAAMPYAAPDPNGPLRLLVFGGSQGARVFSEVVPAAVERLAPALRANVYSRVWSRSRRTNKKSLAAAVKRSSESWGARRVPILAATSGPVHVTVLASDGSA